MLRYLALISIFAFSATSYAQVYKCTDAKNKIIYSDRPCAAGNSQIITDIAPPANPLPSSNQNADEKSSLTKQMDDAVKSAISNDDLIRAQALATSKEQREWVAKAKKEAAQKVASASSANSQGQKASSYECRQARANLERIANSNSDAGMLNAKTSLMQAACDDQYQVSGYGSSPSPYLSYPYSNRHRYPTYPGQYPPSHNNPPAINTGPYDRTIEPNFGSRFIYPQR